MKKTFYDEKNGLWYEQNGDYFIPCLKLPETENNHIGVFGREHLRYLKEHKKIQYNILVTKCELNSYLAKIDKLAQELFDRLIEQMAKTEGVTEHLKEENQMLWVGRMNNIQARAREIVYSEIIYT